MSGAAAPRRRPHRSFLAFDYGTRRVGVAVGNSMLGRGQALATIAAMGDARFEAIGKLVHEWRPDALVVGVPLYPTARRTTTRGVPRRSRAGCTGAFVCRCTRSTSATPRWRRCSAAPRTSTPPPPR